MDAASENNMGKHTLKAHCPNCNQICDFYYAGEQRWPQAVAKAMNIPTSVSLWNCEHCHSTFTEQSLLPQLNVRQSITPPPDVQSGVPHTF